MSDKFWFDPTSDKWALSDGEHYLEVPHWAREIIVNEFERETRQLRETLHRRTEQFEGMTEMWVERGAENAKLRARVDELEELEDGKRYIPQEWYQLATTENVKLRELAERAWKSAERLCQAFDGPCRDDGVTIDKPCPMGERDEECVYGQLQRELRECGVEVDG